MKKLRYAEFAFRLRPVIPALVDDYAQALWLHGRWEEASKECLRLLRPRPWWRPSPSPFFLCGMRIVSKGLKEELRLKGSLPEPEASLRTAHIYLRRALERGRLFPLVPRAAVLLERAGREDLARELREALRKGSNWKVITRKVLEGLGPQEKVGVRSEARQTRFLPSDLAL